MKVTGSHQVDAVGGSYTFEDYMEEIDAGLENKKMVEIISEYLKKAEV